MFQTDGLSSSHFWRKQEGTLFEDVRRRGEGKGKENNRNGTSLQGIFYATLLRLTDLE